MRTPFGWFNSVDDRFECFNSIMQEYQAVNVSGGSLHIYLEDKNDKKSDIEFCLNYAQKRGDYLGMYLAKELLWFGDEFIKDYLDEPIFALAAWRDRNKENQ